LPLTAGPWFENLPSNQKCLHAWPQWNLNTCLYAQFCLQFGFSNHGPTVSSNDGFLSHLDAYDPYASDMTLKSKIHLWMASAEFKYSLRRSKNITGGKRA
jgi:hypothetical protein